MALVCRGGVLREDASGREVAWPRLALFGQEVAHSLSPRLHEAALRALGLPGDYRAVQVDERDFDACLRAAHQASVLGLNVTFPHKPRALEVAASSDRDAREVGAANTLVRQPEEGWKACNTDVAGFTDALQERFPHRPWRGVCVVVGAGGAARAVVTALLRLGAEELRVAARDSRRAEWARARGIAVEEMGRVSLERCSLLVQATPVGWHPDDPSPVEVSALPEGCAVMDLNYPPTPSRLLRSHAPSGPVADGRAMLLAQAVRSFRLWFPGTDPAWAMRRALEEAFHR